MHCRCMKSESKKDEECGIFDYFWLFIQKALLRRFPAASSTEMIEQTPGTVFVKMGFRGEGINFDQPLNQRKKVMLRLMT